MDIEQDACGRHQLTAGVGELNRTEMAVGSDRCTLIDQRTFDAGLGVLSALRPSIVGLRQTSLYKAVCRDALRANPVVCILAGSGDQPAGIVLAVIDYAAYWKRFLIRHPLLAIRILTKKTLNLLTARHKSVSARADGNAEPGEGQRCSVSWGESNRDIAKILFVGVLPAFQRRGIGRELYMSLLSFLKQIGVQRVDARIAPENSPSIRLHRESGWQVGRDAEGMLATISLRPPSTPC